MESYKSLFGDAMWVVNFGLWFWASFFFISPTIAGLHSSTCSTLTSQGPPPTLGLDQLVSNSTLPPPGFVVHMLPPCPSLKGIVPIRARWRPDQCWQVSADKPGLFNAGLLTLNISLCKATITPAPWYWQVSVAKPENGNGKICSSILASRQTHLGIPDLEASCTVTAWSYFSNNSPMPSTIRL